MTEEMPRDEAIEYVLRKCEYEAISVENVKEYPIDYRGEILAARLIQQYEPARLKPAVDVAADVAAKAYSGQLFGDPNMFSHMEDAYRKGFKAGAAWRKDNPKD